MFESDWRYFAEMQFSKKMAVTAALQIFTRQNGVKGEYLKKNQTW